MLKRKVTLLLLISVFILNSAVGQSVPADSLSSKPERKVHIGIYVIPTASFNTGKQIVPYYYDPADCECYRYFYGQTETPGLGYNAGIDVQKMVSKKLSLSIGINLEFFNYSGTSKYDKTFMNPIYSPVYGALLDYEYSETYITIPILLNHSIMKKNNEEEKIIFGGSGGVSASGKNELSGNGESDSHLTAFLISGFDYFSGKKTLMNLGFRLTVQLVPAPSERRYVSAGLKIGVVF